MLNRRRPLAVVAGSTGRDDVAKVMLAAFADRDDVLDLQVALIAAIGAAVIELDPPAPKLVRAQHHGAAASFARFALLGLAAVVEA